MSGFDRVTREEDRLARLSALMRTAPAEQLQGLANELRGQPAAGSPYESDIQAVGADYVGSASGFALLWTIDASPQYLDALDGIFTAATARRHGPRPLIRAVVEHAARAAWLMEPEIDPRARAARTCLAEAVSAAQLQEAMDRGGGEEAVRDAQDRQRWVRQRIAKLFGNSALTTPRSWGAWALAGERYLSMTKVVEIFAARHFPSASGATFYMFQSVLMHPSPASETAFGVRREDGSLEFPDFDPGFTLGVAATAISCWRAAVSDVLTYHGWECAQFDQWWTFANALLSELRREAADNE